MFTSYNSLSSAPGGSPNNEPILRYLAETLFQRTIFWTRTVAVLNGLLFVIGVVAVFSPAISAGYPWVAIPFAMAAVGLGIDVARYKREAERLERVIENVPLRGQVLSPVQLDELSRALPRTMPAPMIQWLSDGAPLPDIDLQSPTRSLKILSERTWFAHHLSAFTAKKLEYIFWTMLGISLALLVFSGVTVSSSPPGTGAAKCIAATLLFALSGSTLRAWQGYHVFALRAREISQDATRAVKDATAEESEARRLWVEFQLARASAPVVLPLVRRLNQARLEDEFQSFLIDGEQWRDPKTGRPLDRLDRT